MGAVNGRVVVVYVYQEAARSWWLLRGCKLQEWLDRLIHWHLVVIFIATAPSVFFICFAYCVLRTRAERIG